jgi:hypothetical protein
MPWVGRPLRSGPFRDRRCRPLGLEPAACPGVGPAKTGPCPAGVGRSAETALRWSQVCPKVRAEPGACSVRGPAAVGGVRKGGISRQDAKTPRGRGNRTREGAGSRRSADGRIRRGGRRRARATRQEHQQEQEQEQEQEHEQEQAGRAAPASEVLASRSSSSPLCVSASWRDDRPPYALPGACAPVRQELRAVGSHLSWLAYLRGVRGVARSVPDRPKAERRRVGSRVSGPGCRALSGPPAVQGWACGRRGVQTPSPGARRDSLECRRPGTALPSVLRTPQRLRAPAMQQDHGRSRGPGPAPPSRGRRPQGGSGGFQPLPVRPRALHGPWTGPAVAGPPTAGRLACCQALAYRAPSGLWPTGAAYPGPWPGLRDCRTFGAEATPWWAQREGLPHLRR